jgi:transposase
MNKIPKRFTYFIGIDVSRNKLDYAVVKDNTFLFHKVARNEPDDIKAFVKDLKEIPGFAMGKAVFCMEHTGFYCNHLLSTLKKVRAHIAVENGLVIRNSSGLLRGKDDKVDSIRIAHFASKNRGHLRFWQPKRLEVETLSALFVLRTRLLTLQNALKTPLEEQSTFIKKAIQKQMSGLCRVSIQAIRNDLEEIDRKLDEVIRQDERLRRLFQQITSVPHIGRITAMQIIISTNEFLDIRNPRKFACYAGIAPFKKESGDIHRRSQVSHIANKKMKALLHICAMSSVRFDWEIKEYYDRKVAEGKPKMAVLNAIRNKLILRVFSCVNQNRLYQKDYQPYKILLQEELLVTPDAIHIMRELPAVSLQ